MNRYKFLNKGKQHLHTLDGKPLVGTSSVSSVLNKPLHWWALQMGLAHLGWTPINDKKTKRRVPKEQRIPVAEKYLQELKQIQTGEEWLNLLDTCYYAHDKEKNRTAKKGTDLHAELERYVKDHMAGTLGEYDPVIVPFIKWTEKNVKRFLWSEMHCYSEKLWVGGISDCGFEDKTGKYGIVDFKSAKEAYLGHFWQCAGYGMLIEENGGFDSDGNKTFTLDKPIDYYVVFPFGTKPVVPALYVNPEKAKRAFLAELELYQQMNQ